MASGKVYFDQRPLLCDAAATICVGACVNSLLSIGGISFNRCIHICHTKIYHSISGLRTNICICVMFWVFGFGVSLPGLFGWTDNIYDHKMLECVWDRTRSLSYTIFFSTVAVFTPILIIATSYIKIVTFVVASKKKVAKICHNQEYISKSRTASLKVAKSLFIIFAIFVICWAPYASVVLIDFQDQAPLEVHLYILLLAHIHATLNAIVYWATNKHFRTGYLIVLARLVGRTVKNTIRSSLVQHSENRQSMGKIEENGSNAFSDNESQKGSKVVTKKHQVIANDGIHNEQESDVNQVLNEELVIQHCEQTVADITNETANKLDVTDEEDKVSESDVTCHVESFNKNVEINIENTLQESIKETSEGNDESENTDRPDGNVKQFVSIEDDMEVENNMGKENDDQTEDEIVKQSVSLKDNVDTEIDVSKEHNEDIHDDVSKENKDRTKDEIIKQYVCLDKNEELEDEVSKEYKNNIEGDVSEEHSKRNGDEFAKQCVDLEHSDDIKVLKDKVV